MKISKTIIVACLMTAVTALTSISAGAATPKVFKQSDYPNIAYGWYLNNNGKKVNATVASSGCGLIALKNAIYSLTNKEVPTKELANFAISRGYRINNVGTSHAVVSDFAKNNGTKYSIKYGGYTTSVNELKNALLKGNTAAYAPSTTLKTGGGHVLAVVDYDSTNNKFLILDSAPSVNRLGSNVTYSWQKLSSTRVTENGNIKFSGFYLIESTRKETIQAPTNVKVNVKNVGQTSTISWQGNAPQYHIEIYTSNGTLEKKLYGIRNTSLGYKFLKSDTYKVYVGSVSSDEKAWKYANPVTVNVKNSTTTRALTLADLPKATVHGYTLFNGTTRQLYSNSALTKPLSGEIWASDMCQLETITDTYIKLKYPTSKGYKTAYIATSAFFNATDIKRVSPLQNATVYRRSTGSTATIGTVFKSDRNVYQIGGAVNGRCQIVYPVSGMGYKVGWVQSKHIK